MVGISQPKQAERLRKRSELAIELLRKRSELAIELYDRYFTT
jgi:hypothetical protein